MSSNSIGNKGVSTLLKHLNDNDTLSVLRLQNVNMDDKASLIISHSMLARGNLKLVCGVRGAAGGAGKGDGRERRRVGLGARSHRERRE